MNMVAIGDVLVINHGGGDAAKPVTTLHMFEKRCFELLGVAVDDSIRVLAKNFHLPLVRFAHTMAFKSVLISTLLLAHLTIPPEFLQTFRFDSVGYRLRRQEFVLTHSEIKNLSGKLKEDIQRLEFHDGCLDPISGSWRRDGLRR